MKAEILCVGTELLLGDIVNTNASYLSKKLAEAGIFVYFHTVCGDNPERLSDCLSLSLSRSDLIVMTGGLGPTYDDLTKETVCEKLGLKLILHEESLERMKSYFNRLSREMTDNNIKQAMVPESSVVFRNDNGTAPGIAAENNGKVVIMLPGPPKEMCPMFDHEVLPYLKKFSAGTLYSRNVNIFGLGESLVESKLSGLMKTSENPTVAPYVGNGEVRVRVTARAQNADEGKKMIAPIEKQIKDLLGSAVYDVDSEGLEFTLVRLLTQKQMKIATAESCTGGLISKRITEVSGSSEVFGYGVCTYANEAKIKLLSVKSETLEKFGAVSSETALEMARGALHLSGADIALSTTGIAGPLGDSLEKPVGLVYVGLAAKDGYETVQKLMLGRGKGNERESIRFLSSSNALKSAIDYCKTVNCNGEK